MVNFQDLLRSVVHVGTRSQIGPEIIDRLLHVLVDVHVLKRRSVIVVVSNNLATQSIDRVSTQHQADVRDGGRSGVEQSARRDVDRVVLGAGLAVAQLALEAQQSTRVQSDRQHDLDAVHDQSSSQLDRHLLHHSSKSNVRVVRRQVHLLAQRSSAYQECDLVCQVACLAALSSRHR